MKRYLEAGKVATTHGVRGELKIQPWADSAEFLKGFSVFYIDGEAFSVRSARIHKGMLIAALEGIDTVEKAEALRGKILCIDREDAHLEEGAYFLADIMGLPAVDADTGTEIGIIKDIMYMPGGDLLVIRGKREILVPRVPEFVRKVDLQEGKVHIHLIEGL